MRIDDVRARPAERLMLWIDAVGGYRLCLAEQISLGRPDPQCAADVAILGDLGDGMPASAATAKGILSTPCAMSA